mgnify:CR=1 FL=1
MNTFFPIMFQKVDGETYIKTPVMLNGVQIWIETFWLIPSSVIKQVSHWTDDKRPIYRYYP